MNSPPPEYEIFDFYVQSTIERQLGTSVIHYESFKYATSIVRCINQIQPDSHSDLNVVVALLRVPVPHSG